MQDTSELDALTLCMSVQRTEAERQEARENAAMNLTNIDSEERTRRIRLGTIMLVRLELNPMQL